MCPSQDHFVFAQKLLIMSDFSLTHIYVGLSDVLVCAGANLFCAIRLQFAITPDSV